MPTAGVDPNRNTLRAKSTKQSLAGRALRDNMFSQLSEGSRRWVTAQRNKRPELSFHYIVRAWQRQAFEDADKYLTQMIGEEQDDLHKTSSAGDVKKYRELLDILTQEWKELNTNTQKRNFILRLTGDNLKCFIMFADSIAKTAPERSFIHRWLQSRALIEIGHDEYERQVYLSYKYLLEPEELGAADTFMQIFIKSSNYKRYLNLSGEEKLVLLLAHYAERGQLEETITRLRRASVRHRALMIRLNEQYIEIIMRLAKLAGHSQNATILRNVFEDKDFYINENILHNFLRSVGKNIYGQTNQSRKYVLVQESIKHFPIPLRRSPKVIAKGDFLEQGLFENHNIKAIINQAA